MDIPRKRSMVMVNHTHLCRYVIIVIGILGRVDCRCIFGPYPPYISLIHPYKYHMLGTISQSPIPRRWGGLRGGTRNHDPAYGAVGASTSNHSATQPPCGYVSIPKVLSRAALGGGEYYPLPSRILFIAQNNSKYQCETFSTLSGMNITSFVKLLENPSWNFW